MEEEELRLIFREILTNYKKHKQSERYYLFYLIDEEPAIPYYLKPITIQKSTISLQNISNKPNTSVYIKSQKNIAAKEQENLSFLPYNDFTCKVHYSTDLEIYKTNPYNQSTLSSEFIQNTQLAEYLVLNIVKHYPINADWIQVSQILAEYTGKNKRLMLSIFNEIMKKHFFSHDTLLKKQEFRENFCQICKKYACSTHFFDERVLCESDDDNKKVEKVYVEDAITVLDPHLWKIRWWSREKSILKTGKWIKDYNCCDKSLCSKYQVSIKNKIAGTKKQIIKKFLKLGINNPCAISLFVGIACKETKEYLLRFDPKYLPPMPLQKLPKKIYYTSQNENKLILINVLETHCHCKNECSVINKCPCLIGEISNSKLINRRCCEKYCLCSIDCKVRFLGCNCQYGKCDSKTCICWINLRECDPELCFFCNSYQSVIQKPLEIIKKKRKDTLLCRNIKNQIRLNKRTAMGESGIKGAGMGLFVMESCDINEYITEYTGEIISEAESERRAAVYDYRHHSYIFSLSPDTRWAIDSTYIGSKMRYVNHKSHHEHNTYSQVWNVNGNLKILLFAAEKIQQFHELFFDYGYDSKEIKYEWLQQYEKKFKKTKNLKIK